MRTELHRNMSVFPMREKKDEKRQTTRQKAGGNAAGLTNTGLYQGGRSGQQTGLDAVVAIFDRITRMTVESVLVTQDLTVELVDEHVDGRV